MPQSTLYVFLTLSSSCFCRKRFIVDGGLKNLEVKSRCKRGFELSTFFTMLRTWLAINFDCKPSFLVLVFSYQSFDWFYLYHSERLRDMFERHIILWFQKLSRLISNNTVPLQLCHGFVKCCVKKIPTASYYLIILIVAQIFPFSYANG